MWSRSMTNADPGVDSQPREEMSKSSSLEEGGETAMMLERETEGGMRGTETQ